MEYKFCNKKKYEKVKKFSHSEMEQFLQGIYEQGKKDVAQKPVDYKAIHESILGVKGIGAKKAEEVMCVVKEMVG